MRAPGTRKAAAGPLPCSHVILACAILGTGCLRWATLLVSGRHPTESIMRSQSQKYWHDLLLPVLRQDRPPIVPQAIVLQDQQVLLVQRDTPRFWELPGGSMIPGETPEATVAREVQEETGVHV